MGIVVIEILKSSWTIALHPIQSYQEEMYKCDRCNVLIFTSTNNIGIKHHMEWHARPNTIISIYLDEFVIKARPKLLQNREVFAINIISSYSL